jgi:hypothetical protein
MDTLSTRPGFAKKTKAFYANILNPDATDLICIDRHQIAASIQRPESTMPLDNRMAAITPLQYEFFSECTREAAKRVEMSNSSCQALVWISYRNCRGLFQHKPNDFELPSYMEANPF